VKKHAIRWKAVALALCVSAAGVGGADAELAVGAEAPAFTLMGSDGRLHSLAEHVGRRGVVLAWFPKAFTPG
jgi:peroxiredoxin Q/BCP